MEILQKTVFVCPVTGGSFDTQESAKESAEKAIKNKELSESAAEQAEKQRIVTEAEMSEKNNWLRLDVANVFDIPLLIKEKAREFWGLDADISFIDFSFGDVSSSHSAPIGEKNNWERDPSKGPISFLGWSGRVIGSVQGYQKKEGEYCSVKSVIFPEYYPSKTGFRGFYAGSGCPGDVNGRYRLDMSISIFLQDFPKLQEKYNIWLQNKQIADNYNRLQQDHRQSSYQKAKKHPKVVQLADEIARLILERSALEKSYYNFSYDQDTPTIPVLDESLENLNKNFGGYTFPPVSLVVS